MLVLLEPKALQGLTTTMVYNWTKPHMIFNLNSNAAQNYPTLNLMPPPGIIQPQSQEFDNWFINYIVSNDASFMDLIKLVSFLRFGYDVFVLVYNESEIFNPISETIAKLIQQRYGYNYQMISDSAELYEYDESGFTAEGIQTFDQDFKRVQELQMRINPAMFINEKIHDEHL